MKKRTNQETAALTEHTIEQISNLFKTSPLIKALNEEYEKKKSKIQSSIINKTCDKNNINEEWIRTVAGWM